MPGKAPNTEPPAQLTARGMTLRDYAVITMMAAWRQSEVGTPFEDRIDSQCLAKLAVEDADAMLAARSKL